VDIKTAIKYASQYRRNGRSCYVHVANRGVHVLQTPIGPVEFRSHAQSGLNGRSKTKFCAYLLHHVDGGTGRPVPTKDFPKLVPA